jgi:hypothetical protein
VRIELQNQSYHHLGLKLTKICFVGSFDRIIPIADLLCTPCSAVPIGF